MSTSDRTPPGRAIERRTAAMVITTFLSGMASFLQDKEAAGGHAAPSRKRIRFSLARETHADKRPKYPRVEVLPRVPGDRPPGRSHRRPADKVSLVVIDDVHGAAGKIALAVYAVVGIDLCLTGSARGGGGDGLRAL